MYVKVEKPAINITAPKLIDVFINDNLYQLPLNSRLWSALPDQIPHFCYHPTLSIAGNCRMCLIEHRTKINAKFISKIITACTQLVTPQIQNTYFYTKTKEVLKAREKVLEYILLNHPLDCPVCDQAGECDLQDQAQVYGSDDGAYYDAKNTVSDEYWGPTVKTILTRCILCTRCVRYSTEILGLSSLITYGRGSTTQIKCIEERDGKTILRSELSGNVIDLCPVGTITLKAYTRA